MEIVRFEPISFKSHMMKLTPSEKDKWQKKLSHVTVNEKCHTISFPYESCEVEDGFWEIQCSKIDIFEKGNN